MLDGQAQRNGGRRRARGGLAAAALAAAVGVAWTGLRPGSDDGAALVDASAEPADALAPPPAAGPAFPLVPAAPATTAPAPPTTVLAPPGAPATVPGTAVPPAAGPGRVYVAGDSLTFTAIHPHGMGGGAPAGVEVAAGFGWTAADAQPSLAAHQSASPVDTLVVALGTNDSSPAGGGDGWTDADAENLRRLVGTVGDQACVVLVLPGYGPGALPAHGVEIDEARQALLALAADRAAGDWYGPTVVVDWQAALDAHPGAVAPDGIHMPGPVDGLADPAAAALRRDLMWGGVDGCAET